MDNQSQIRSASEERYPFTFLAYTGTMEEEILRRMGVKLKYAQLLYGKEAAGCLVEVSSYDVQREIIHAALQGEAFKSGCDAVRSIFDNSSEKTIRVSIAPTDSPVAASAVVVTFTHFSEGEVVQLGLFPGFEPVASAAAGAPGICPLITAIRCRTGGKIDASLMPGDITLSGMVNRRPGHNYYIGELYIPFSLIQSINEGYKSSSLILCHSLSISVTLSM